jgi:hypothetical protein
MVEAVEQLTAAAPVRRQLLDDGCEQVLARPEWHWVWFCCLAKPAGITSP